jgi:hypothetical protein
MRSRVSRLILLGGTLALISGCATSEQWADWRGHSTHFASGQHGVFSLRNTEKSTPRVRRSDIEADRLEKWWGQVVSVRPEQIFQN